MFPEFRLTKISAVYSEANGNHSDAQGSGETDMSGHGFMFWNMYKSLGKPILCALVSGDAATTMDEEWVQDRDKACQKAVDNAIKALKRAFQVILSLTHTHIHTYA